MPVDSEPGWYIHRAPDWELCRNLTEGERAIKDAGKTYLPVPEGMLEASAGGFAPGSAYTSYVERADYFDGYGRVIDGLFGMIFRKDAKLEPENRDAVLDEITDTGRTIESLARLHAREVLNLGRHGLLVDMAIRQVDEESETPVTITIAEVQRQNLRPYITEYRAEDIIDLVFEDVANRRTLAMVRLAEVEKVPHPSDEFARIELVRVRVLELVPITEDDPVGPRVYQQRLFGQTLQGEAASKELKPLGPPVRPTQAGQPLDYIPFYWTDADADMETDEPPPPPLLALAQKNVSLYRTLADLEHGAWFCGLPQPYITGVNEGDTDYIVGSPVAWIIPPEDAKVGILSHNGDGLKILEQRAADKKQEMALLGARILEPSGRQVEAFGTALVHRQGEISVLQSIALLCSETLTEAVRELLKWAGSPTAESFAIELNTDFVPQEASPAIVKTMLEALISGSIPGSDWWDFLKRGEVIKSDRSWEDAQKEIEDAMDDDASGMRFPDAPASLDVQLEQENAA